MRTFVTSLALIIAITGVGVRQAVAQRPDQPMKLFASASDVEALIAKAKRERKPDQANFSQPIVAAAPYRANLEYRAVVGTASAHKNDAEVFYVIEGKATMVTGGKLVNESQANAATVSGTAIEGGLSRVVSKGDFIIVPENTPHWFSSIDGEAIVVMTLHVPRPVPAAK